MEQAIFISKIVDLSYVIPKYTRLYFGNEFCQRLIPSLSDLERISKFVSDRKMDFTLVTPYVTDDGLRCLIPILRYVIDHFDAPEIVINDWGVFKVVKDEFDYSNLVLGRLLTKQKRGPRLLNIREKAPQEMFQHFKQSNVDVPILTEYLSATGVKRVELDNLLQGLDREEFMLKASLYLPFSYVSTTRFCLTAFCESEKKSLRTIPECNKECRKYTFRLKHKSMPVDLYLKGNSQFFKNECVPDNLECLGINRLVYQPEIPM